MRKRFLIAALILVLVLIFSSCSQDGKSVSDDEKRAKINEYIRKEKDWGDVWSQYDLNDAYELRVAESIFSDYGARLYKCVWSNIRVADNKPAERIFLLKGELVIPIEAIDSRTIEFDVDKDNGKELVYYVNWDINGTPATTYYLIDKQEDNIYSMSYYGTFPPAEEQKGDDFIVLLPAEGDAQGEYGATGKLELAQEEDSKRLLVAADEKAAEIEPLF